MDSLSRFRKADSQDKAWAALMRFALTLEPGIATGFLQGIRQLRATLNEAEVVRWIQAGNAERAAQMVMRGFGEHAFDGLRNAIVQAGIAAAENEAKNAHIVVRFESVNPRSLVAIQQQGASLVREVAETTRAGIRGYVEQGLMNGLNPIDQARDIRTIIGLTERQARAVANFRRLLTRLDPEALTRALRDKRFDRTVLAAIEAGQALPAAHVDRMVQAYHKRYLKYRSEVIARSESIGALYTGQQDLWSQAVASGSVSADEMVRFWYTADDGKMNAAGHATACDKCKEIARLNPNGVGLRAAFRTPTGLVMGPPVHPQCRCVVFTRLRAR